MTAFSLDDKYTLTEGRVAITGVQALVRLPMDQHRRDREAGLRVGAFISGYPGSPLGEYDKQLQRANRLLADHDVVCRPAINEESAATAIYGAQLLERFPHQRFDGVVGIWYGKTPGVDRTGDAFRHGNFIGTGKHGGVLVLAGDDTACKSSTIPGDSTISLFDLSIPVLYPGDPAEVLEFGLHGIALSRYAGLWTGLKIVTNVADGGAVIDLPHPRPPILPDFDIGGRRFEKQLDMRLLPPYSIELERQIFSERTAAALAYVHANGLDSIRCVSPGDRIGLVAAGKPYRDLRLALELLGLDEAALDRHGIRVLKLGCIAPIEPRRLREFAPGLEEIIVVEDKRGFVVTQIRQVLYNLPDRPLVGGKETPGGETLFPMHGELEGHDMARILGTYLEHRLPGAAPAERLAHLRAGAESAELATKLPAALPRTPYFCSGCPHNTSTQLPEGSDVAGGGSSGAGGGSVSGGGAGSSRAGVVAGDSGSGGSEAGGADTGAAVACAEAALAEAVPASFSAAAHAPPSSASDTRIRSSAAVEAALLISSGSCVTRTPVSGRRRRRRWLRRRMARRGESAEPGVWRWVAPPPEVPLGAHPELGLSMSSYLLYVRKILEIYQNRMLIRTRIRVRSESWPLRVSLCRSIPIWLRLCARQRRRTGKVCPPGSGLPPTVDLYRAAFCR